MATTEEKIYNDQLAPAANNTQAQAQGYDSTQPVRSTAPATYTPTGAYDPANVQQFNQQNEQKLNAMYDANKDSALSQLKTAYDQNLSNEQAAMDKIAPQYQESANQLGAEYERQRRNNAIQALANGLNTGAGSQIALAQSMAYQNNQTALQKAQNQALQDAQRRITDLQNKYQNDIAAAIADNDAQRAAALYNEYQNAYKRQLDVENTNYERNVQAEQQAYQRAYQEENRDYQRAYQEQATAYERQQTQAQQLAQYGDFSGYREIYGNDVANQMERTWLLNNPGLAYTMGKLSADDYFKLTGNYPPDVLAAMNAAAEEEDTSSGSSRSRAPQGYYSSGSVTAWQKAHGITADGIAGGQTKKKLEQVAAGTGADAEEAAQLLKKWY